MDLKTLMIYSLTSKRPQKCFFCSPNKKKFKSLKPHLIVFINNVKKCSAQVEVIS